MYPAEYTLHMGLRPQPKLDVIPAMPCCCTITKQALLTFWPLLACLWWPSAPSQQATQQAHTLSASLLQTAAELQALRQCWQWQVRLCEDRWESGHRSGGPPTITSPQGLQADHITSPDAYGGRASERDLQVLLAPHQ